MNNNIFSNKSFEIIDLFIKNANQTLHGREIARKLGLNQKTTQTITKQSHKYCSHKKSVW